MTVKQSFLNSISGGKPIAGTAHGIDQLVVSGFLKRLPQAANMDVNSALLDKNVIAPHLVKQLRT